MKERPTHTTGPFDIRPVMGEHYTEVYSTVTGECVASVHSRQSREKDAPQYETSLQNAALLKAAPRLRQSLETILGDPREKLQPATAKSARSLLAEIDRGPSGAFLKERNQQRRDYEVLLRAHIDEMALQSDVGPDDNEELKEEAELEEDEDQGHSLG